MPLRKTFRVSAASTEYKKNYIISIDNISFGEAAGSIFYGPDESTIEEDIIQAIESLPSDIKSVMELIDLAGREINPVSKSGILSTVLHYLSYKNNEYPWKLVEVDRPGKIVTSFTISIDQPEKMLAEIKQSPYPIIKLKMGFEEDEALMPFLKDMKDKIFRIDANGGWSPEKAQKMIYLAKQADINIIEQPTAVEYISEWKYLSRGSSVNLFIDEGLNSLDDYYKYSDYVNGINIKMAKSGGILEAKKIALRAKKDKMKIMLGCMVESSIGISPAIYLSSMADYFDFDGPLLLQNDIATGIQFNIEQIAVDDNIIGGPKMKEEFLNA